MDLFIVCGLGSLGQNCVLALKEFGVQIIAIDEVQQIKCDIPHFSSLLYKFVVGDSRLDSVLQQAHINKCRAALIVTNDEQVNTETAIAIRQLNPQTRLIVRSTKTNLNQLLSEQLGNYVAYDPSQLPAPAFAVAGLGKEMLGFFYLEGKPLRVIQSKVDRGDLFNRAANLFELNNASQRVIGYLSDSKSFPPPQSFYEWDAQAVPQAGDTISYIEVCETFSHRKLRDKSLTEKPLKRVFHTLYKKLFAEFKQFSGLNFQEKIQRVAIFSGLVVITLLILGTILIHQVSNKSSIMASFYATAILLLGGYGDLFGNLEDIPEIPWWLQLFSLILTLVGTAFVGVLYALLTDSLLESKFHFINKRPPVPEKDHVVIVGMGRIGQRVVKVLQEFQEAVVGMDSNLDLDPTILPKMPLIIGNINHALVQANLATAKSLIVVTDEEILNLEIALMAHKLNPSTNIVIRTQGQGLCRHLMNLLPQAQVLQVYQVAAEAFAGAAFGENIISIFRCHNQTILVTEYYIEAQDTLSGLLLSELACGYHVTIILHQRGENPAVFMPSDDITLREGDRLVVLATIKALQRIEKGEINQKDKIWGIYIEKALTSEAAFEGANAIARITGCNLIEAREIFHDLPKNLPMGLYKPQALRLVKELNKCLVKASMVNNTGHRN